MPIKVWDEIASIPKLQQLHFWSLGMDKYFHLTHYDEYDYFNSILGLT